jgi:hypothetical protein
MRRPSFRILALALFIALYAGVASAAPQAANAPARSKAARTAVPAPLVKPSPDVGSPEWLRQQAIERAEERHLQDVMKLCRC